MNRNIAQVRARLEESVAGLPGEPIDAADELCRLEMVSFQVLDSEYDLYPPGQLQELLMTYLRLREIELGLLQWPDQQEE